MEMKIDVSMYRVCMCVHLWLLCTQMCVSDQVWSGYTNDYPRYSSRNYVQLPWFETLWVSAYILKNIFLIRWQIVVFQPTFHIFPTNFLFECARGSFTINIICYLKYLITCMIQKVRCCMLTYLPLFRISQLVHCNYT